MVSDREWSQLNEWVARVERRQELYEAETAARFAALERENAAKNAAQDVAIHAVEVTQAKASAWQAFAPWIGVVVVGLAGLGAVLSR